MPSISSCDRRIARARSRVEKASGNGCVTGVPIVPGKCTSDTRQNGCRYLAGQNALCRILAERWCAGTLRPLDVPASGSHPSPEPVPREVGRRRAPAQQSSRSVSAGSLRRSAPRRVRRCLAPRSIPPLRGRARFRASGAPAFGQDLRKRPSQPRGSPAITISRPPTTNRRGSSDSGSAKPRGPRRLPDRSRLRGEPVDRVDQQTVALRPQLSAYPASGATTVVWPDSPTRAASGSEKCDRRADEQQTIAQPDAGHRDDQRLLAFWLSQKRQLHGRP